MVQMQSKDMASRFSKKGKVNADEVQLLESIAKALFSSGLMSFVCVWCLGLVRFHDSPTPSSLPLQISLRPAQSFILNKKQVQKLSSQMTMNPAQGSGQVMYSNLIKNQI